MPVLDPGEGWTKTGRLWCYAVDDRPWCGPGHPAAAYAYSEDRKGKRPAAHLMGFRGVLQVDGYAGLIECLWRSLNYECVYLHAFETGSELRAGLSKWIGYYNTRRSHSTLDGRTPDEAYGIDMGELAA